MQQLEIAKFGVSYKTVQMRLPHSQPIFKTTSHC
jgi:hypothetical protein